MEYQHPEISKVAQQLKAKFAKLEDKRQILRAAELSSLYEQLKLLPAGPARASFGKQVNSLRAELEQMVKQADRSTEPAVGAIDVSAPFDVNTESNRPGLLPAEHGSLHPLMSELRLILDIFYRMGFNAVESREIDDDYHMFTSLNFPPEHPARDDYDTFVTDEELIAPAHTSTMQNRVLKHFKSNLKDGRPIAVVMPGRVFRNEDLDARHEHTFYQLEGVFVDEGINAGHLVATIRAWLSNYFGKTVMIKIQPFYFPFTEPSFEFAASCPFCDQAGCNICGYSGWIELLGCGLIHPNVLAEAGIDAETYSGFAWGGGLERLVMMKYDIEDVRHFESGSLRFLRQFS